MLKSAEICKPMDVEMIIITKEHNSSKGKRKEKKSDYAHPGVPVHK